MVHTELNDCRNYYKTIVLNKRQECDFELIVNGGFSPLTGFLNKSDYETVVNTMRLSNGALWSMPITLCIDTQQAEELKKEQFVLLENETGLLLGLMDISNPLSIYKPDITHEFNKVYGGDDENHPYVKILKTYQNDGKVYNLGGEIVKFILPPRYDFEDIRLTPHETKLYFKNNDWSKIIGFQTRNPVHRSHFELTKYALKQVGKDAKLLLHPVVGITQDCDINYHVRVKCYKKLLPYYNDNTVLLSLLPLSMRMAGPREAIWHAQIRKNYGCTHFVVGRDHAGPSYKRKNGDDFYGPYDAQNMLLEYANEIEINIIVSKLIVYAVPKSLQLQPIYSSIDKINDEEYTIMNISGTKQREMLSNGEDLPTWFTFPEIANELKKSYKEQRSGFCIYLVGLSGSGKSTIANYLISKINEISNKKITYLDGDIVRKELSKGLGFSKEDRSINTRRIGYVCSEVVKHGGIAIASNIAPYSVDREHNRNIINQNGKYIEIYIKTSLSVCEKRDVKGFYKLAREGIIKEFTGISDPFEEPEDSEIILDGNVDIHTNLDFIMTYLTSKKLLV